MGNRSRRRCEEGATAADYAVTVSLLPTLIFGIVTALRISVRDLLGTAELADALS